MAKFKIDLEAETEKTAAAKNAGRNSAKETQPAEKKPAKEKKNTTHVQTQVEAHRFLRLPQDSQSHCTDGLSGLSPRVFPTRRSA